MSLWLDSYSNGIVTSIEKAGKHISRVHFVDMWTKQAMIAVLSCSPLEIWDEIECIFNQDSYSPLAWRNITQGITKKRNSNIQLPHEISNSIVEHASNFWDIYFQNMHFIATNYQRAEYIYDKYNYLVEHGKIAWGWRDPRNTIAFKTLKHMVENTRNILFFYHVEKARERILYTYEQVDENIVTEERLKWVILRHYDDFLDDTKNFPIPRQTLHDFHMYFGEVRQKVGL